jgi:hypothetical protein
MVGAREETIDTSGSTCGTTAERGQQKNKPLQPNPAAPLSFLGESRPEV